MPTPAVAYLTRALRLSAGIVISASHNPFEDNGIKFFSADGDKLPDITERAIEARLEEPIACAPSAKLGKAWRVNDAAGRYIEFCKSTFPGALDLRGLKLVLDCAHGATYHIARHVFHELGADVVAIGNQPDGLNINEGCGAVHPEGLRLAVREHGAHYGIAFDGDGDRLVMVDGAGNAYDGDQLVYVIAAHRRRLGTLAGGVVGTQMTNLALEHALGLLGIPFARAKVGDRYVLELLLEKGWMLGGENSGHIICLDKHTTGDGIVSALQVLWAVRESRQPLAALAGPVELYPQILINVRVPERFDFQRAPDVRAALEAAEGDLHGQGRVLLRASGTEPLIRVMVEGRSRGQVQQWAEAIAHSVEQAATAAAR
jgi:phosphoglucosamine mutase